MHCMEEELRYNKLKKDTKRPASKRRVALFTACPNLPGIREAYEEAANLKRNSIFKRYKTSPWGRIGGAYVL